MSINAISVVLSFFGILTPVTGVLVHNFTSLFVVISSAFILKTRYIRPAGYKEEAKKQKAQTKEIKIEKSYDSKQPQYENGRKLCMCGKQKYCTCGEKGSTCGH